MLDKLRKGAGGWIAQLFIAVLVLSFGLWGISSFFTGFRSDTVSTVGGTDISIQNFQREYEQAVRQMSQQIGQQLTNEQAQSFGLPSQVLGRLVAEATLDDAAVRLRLGISNKTLAQEIVEDPTFHGTGSSFDRAYFLQLLRSNGMNQDDYIAERRAVYVRQQIADGLIGGLQVPDVYLRALHEFQEEARSIKYLVLPPSLVGAPPVPTDADLNTYFNDNKDQWKAPEYRAITTLGLSPGDIAKAADVNDAEAQKTYDAEVAQRFTTPETRKVSQIVFKNSADAQAAAAELAGGKSFADLLAEKKIKPEDADLGTVTRDKIIDPAIADAAFKLETGGTSGVVQGRFGQAIVHVDTVNPQVVKPFADVKDALKLEIATKRAAASIQEEHDSIEDARAAGQTLAEIGQKYNLKLATIPTVDASGNDQNGKPVADLPKSPDFLSQAFATDVGIANEPVEVDQNSYVWYEVTNVTAAHDRTLAEVHDKVLAAWQQAKVEEKLAAKANDVRDRLSKGDDIAKIAGDLSVDVKTADKLTRQSKPTADLSAPAIAGAFGGPVGFSDVAPGVDVASRIVLVVTDATTPPYVATAPGLTQAKQQLAGQISDDMLRQYIQLMQSQIGVSVNQTAMQQALGTGSNAPGT